MDNRTTKTRCSRPGPTPARVCQSPLRPPGWGACGSSWSAAAMGPWNHGSLS